MLDNHGHVIEIERRIVSAAAAAETAEAGSELEARLARAAAAEEEAARRVRTPSSDCANRSPTSSAGDRPQLGGAGQHHQERSVDRGEAALLQLHPRAGGRADRAREVGLVADQQDLAPAGRQLLGVEVAAPEAPRISSTSTPSSRAGDAGRCRGPAPSGWSRQASIFTPSAASAVPAARAWRSPFSVSSPRGVVGGVVLGVAVAQQPDHRLERIRSFARSRAAAGRWHLARLRRSTGERERRPPARPQRVLAARRRQQDRGDGRPARPSSGCRRSGSPTTAS